MKNDLEAKQASLLNENYHDVDEERLPDEGDNVGQKV